MRMLNLTQHVATAEQLAAGVVEPTDKVAIQKLLTFDEEPTFLDVNRRAAALADIVKKAGFFRALIGGAPFFMAPLEDALAEAGVEVYYSFSKRESVDIPQPDGSVKKTQVFKHVAFVGTMPFDRSMLDVEE